MPLLHSSAGGKTVASSSGWELFLDPHFVCTMLSLCFSVSVFFYYLYQLLCRREALERRDAFVRGLKARREAREDIARLQEARLKLDSSPTERPAPIALGTTSREPETESHADRDASSKQTPPVLQPRPSSSPVQQVRHRRNARQPST